MIERRTRQLNAVLEAVRASCDHPTAHEVYEQVSHRLPRISRATVYRNLKKLEQHRRIRAVRIEGQATRYDPVVGDHAHFLCDQCHRIVDLPEVYLRHRRVAALERSGYAVRSQSTVYSGACPQCKTPRSEHVAFDRPRPPTMRTAADHGAGGSDRLQ